MKTPFSFVVLRYMHDGFTREFVNVGVLLYAPGAGFLRLRRVASLERAQALFPGLETAPLGESLRFLETRCTGLEERYARTPERESLSAEIIAKSLLPTDDSALQWSTPGGGTTEAPERTLQELFERIVTRHEKARNGALMDSLASAA
ncbi:MAG: DUF3037 domain-containing protein [Verrucomicrobia bacterium]|nr:DUF3037 domain-containing protein [Verrucomicrobiota bacterium]